MTLLGSKFVTECAVDLPESANACRGLDGRKREEGSSRIGAMVSVDERRKKRQILKGMS